MIYYNCYNISKLNYLQFPSSWWNTEGSPAQNFDWPQTGATYDSTRIMSAVRTDKIRPEDNETQTIRVSGFYNLLVSVSDAVYP